MKHFKRTGPSADPLAGFAEFAAAANLTEDETPEVQCDFCARGWARLTTPEGYPACLDCAEMHAAPRFSFQSRE